MADPDPRAFPVRNDLDREAIYGPPRRTRPSPPTTGQGVRRIIALAGILLVMGLSATGVLRSREEGAGLVMLLLVLPSVAIVSAIPFVVYLTELRTTFTSLFAGVGLLAATLLMYLAIINSAAPGAYFGFVLAPLLNLFIVAFAMLVDFFRLGPR